MEYQSVLKIVFVIVLIIAYVFLAYNVYETYRLSENVQATMPKEEINGAEAKTEEQAAEEDKQDEATKYTEPKATNNLISLGEFKLTAYCSCSTCCKKWAYDRPKDENGNDIVIGSIGERLTAGVSIAVDPSVIPYRSEVIINGHTYIAQDCGGAIKGNRIDIYFNSHQEALNFGVQYAEVFLVEEN